MLKYSFLLSFVLAANLCVSHSKTLKSPQFVLTKVAADQEAANSLKRTRRQASSTNHATIETFHVSSLVMSRYSRVTVTSNVRNDDESAQEVAVELRLPKNAFISNFSMEIDSVTYVGIVKEKKAAKAQYEAAVSRGESAGLVTAKTRNAQSFAVSVNVAAGRTVTFRLNYQELLVRKLGQYNHVIYANPGQSVRDLMVEVRISEPTGVEEVTAAPPSSTTLNRKGEENLFDNHENVVIRRSKTQAYISYSPTVTQQNLLHESDVSFVVTYDVTREQLGGEILIKDGYFVHFFAPQNLPVIPKNVVFVIDKSGSMSGSKIKQTREALLTILDDLGEQDKFNIIAFSSESHVWRRNEMMDASSHNVRRAKSFVRNINANGGTNFYGAMMDGVSLLETVSDSAASSLEEAYMLILLTDGQPTIGITDNQRIRRDVAQTVNGRYSVFCLGFGSDLDHEFLQKLAQENKGLSRQIYTDSDAALQLKGFYDEVASPLLTHVILKYKGFPTTDITTCTFDTFYGGSELLITGRLSLDHNEQEPSDLQVSVAARSATGDVTIISKGKEIEETFAEESFDMEKLWAYLTIKDLLKNKTKESENAVAVKVIETEILRLSLKFNFVTPLTSMVVTKPGDDAVVDEEDQFPPIPRLGYKRTGSLQSRIAKRPIWHSAAVQHSTLRSFGRISRQYDLSHWSPLSRLYNGFSGPPATQLVTTTTTTTTTTTRPTTTTPPTETTAPLVQVPVDPLNLERTCGENIILDSSVNITSPRFPGLYPSNTQCVWKISFPQWANDDGSKKIRITFPRMDLEDDGSCNRDRVIVYQDFDANEPEESQVQTRCGFHEDERFLDASTNFVVVFQSDETVNGRGFMANLNILPVI